MIATFADKKTAYSVDVILSNKKLKKRTGTVAGVQTFFQTPEDLISAKLRMIKATVSEERALKDKEDVRAILKFSTVDVEAIKKKAEKPQLFQFLKLSLLTRIFEFARPADRCRVLLGHAQAKGTETYFWVKRAL